MSSVVVVIPYLTQLWCLEDCLASFGESDVPVLIVDNSDNNDCAELELPPNVEVQHYGKNIGVSAAWNLGIKKGADQTLLLSQWVRFAPAELEWRKEKPWGLSHVAEGINRLATEYGLEFADQGYHCISIGRKTVEEIGLFDSNLVVFGNEDDYQHRRELAGIKGFMNCWGDHDESGVYSIAFGIHKRNGILEDIPMYKESGNYYSSKWCSKPFDFPGDYKYPFNNPDNSLKYWPMGLNGEKWDETIDTTPPS